MWDFLEPNQRVARRKSNSPCATFTLERGLLQKQCQTIWLFDFQFVFEAIFVIWFLLRLLRGVCIRSQELLTPLRGRLCGLWCFFFFLIFKRLLAIIYGRCGRCIVRANSFRLSVFLLKRNETRLAELWWMMELCMGHCNHGDRRAQHELIRTANCEKRRKIGKLWCSVTINQIARMKREKQYCVAGSEMPNEIMIIICCNDGEQLPCRFWFILNWIECMKPLNYFHFSDWSSSSTKKKHFQLSDFCSIN